MPSTRPVAVVAALASAALWALVAAPILGAVALAADPTIVVAAGDTLTGISKRHGVTLKRLVELNAIADPNLIVPGQVLVVAQPPAPASPVPAAAPAAARVHRVATGENLTFIARRYGVTIAAIVSANGIADASRIFVGQSLTIPGAPRAAAGAAATSSVPSRMATVMAERDTARRVIEEEASRFGVPAPLALAVAWQESGWRQDVVSHAGAVGVMQVMPATGVWVGEAMLGEPVDLGDLRGNARAGVRLLRHYLDRYDGSWDLALAAYYQGQRALDHHGIYPVSQSYIASVKAIARLLGG